MIEDALQPLGRHDGRQLQQQQCRTHHVHTVDHAGSPIRPSGRSVDEHAMVDGALVVNEVPGKGELDPIGSAPRCARHRHLERPQPKPGDAPQGRCAVVADRRARTAVEHDRPAARQPRARGTRAQPHPARQIEPLLVGDRPNPPSPVDAQFIQLTIADQSELPLGQGENGGLDGHCVAVGHLLTPPRRPVVDHGARTPGSDPRTAPRNSGAQTTARPRSGLPTSQTTRNSGAQTTARPRSGLPTSERGSW